MDNVYGSSNYNPSYIDDQAKIIDQKTQRDGFPNIETPTATIQVACNNMNTVEILQPAYDMCLKLKESPEEAYEEMYAAENNNAERATSKVTLMQQACNAVFCNSQDTALEIIDKDPICFPMPSKIDPLSGEDNIEDDPPYPDAPQPIKEKAFAVSSFIIAALCIFVPIVLYMTYLAWTNFLYPHVLRPIYEFIMVQLFKISPFGHTREYFEMQKTLEDNIKKMKEILNSQ
jgi:hypothetical protein